MASPEPTSEFHQTLGLVFDPELPDGGFKEASTSGEDGAGLYMEGCLGKTSYDHIHAYIYIEREGLL